MKQETINQMRSYLYDTNLCRSDFEKYDLPSLENVNEPFFWMVRQHGTSLMFIGYSTVKQWYEKESRRMELFRDKTAPLVSFLFYRNYTDAKFFFWNGTVLLQVNLDQICQIYDSFIDKSYQELCRDFKAEFEMCQKPLPVKFASNETEADWNKTVKFAADMGDESPVQCLEKLQSHQRMAIDQYILIFRDYCGHSFNFAEIVNGECRINGGIIYHDDKTDTRWQTHT